MSHETQTKEIQVNPVPKEASFRQSVILACIVTPQLKSNVAENSFQNSHDFKLKD